MTERKEEQLALHALSTLSAEEVRLLESEWRYDTPMRDEFAELEDAAASMALLLPAEAPPEDLRSQVLAEARRRKRSSVVPFAAPLRLLRVPLVAWAAAAAVALGAFGLWTRNHQLDQRVLALTQSEAAAQGEVAKARGIQQNLEKQLADATTKAAGLAAELDHVKQGFALSRMEVAMLRSSIKRYEEGVALVVWDQEKQEGLLKLEHMPPVQTGKDYQLWVLCKQQRLPVNAGVIKVNAQGVAIVTFKPAKRIAELSKFAMSLEKEGGVPEVEGPVILASQ